MRPPLSPFRMWLVYYRDDRRAVGIIAAGLFFILLPLLGGLVWLAYPTGPAELIQGRIEALGFHETEFGSAPVASVWVDGRPVRIGLPARYGCTTGDRITLQRRPTRFGSRYRIGANARPCTRGHPLPPPTLLPI